MKLKFSLAALLAASALTAKAVEPKKFIVGFDLSYDLTLSSRYDGESYSRGQINADAIGLRLKALYQVAPRWRVGAGVELTSAYYSDDTFPIFATAEYKPFSASSPILNKLYLFGSLGYAPSFGKDRYDYSAVFYKDVFPLDDYEDIVFDESNSISGQYSGYNYRLSPGFRGELGVGFRHMFRPRFGLNFQLGYTTHQERQGKMDAHIVTSEGTEDSSIDFGKIWFHGLTFGVGLVF
jgi:hypothetical protein